jgi:hypothetical protein
MKHLFFSAALATLAIVPASAQDLQFRLNDNGVAIEPRRERVIREREIIRERERDTRSDRYGREYGREREDRRRYGDQECEMVTVRSRLANGETIVRRERRCS